MIATIASLLLSCGLSGVTVSLPAEARVRGTEMTVGEVAVVTGTDPEEVRRVRETSLGYAPAPGYSRLMQSWMIQNRLREALPGTAATIDGKSACRIVPLTELVPRVAFENTAQAALDEIFAGREATITLHAPVRDLEIPAGDQPFELSSALTNHEVRAGLWNVPLRVAIDGKAYQTVWTSWKVELFELLPVLRHDVRAGERLEPSTVELKRTRVTDSSSGRPLTDPMVTGAIALRDLRQGSVITSRDVRRPKIVQTGDVVHLQVRKRAVTARVAAEALEGGHIGDRIRVSVAGGRVMTAVILSRDVVEVNLARPTPRSNQVAQADRGSR
jgi:flagella basal body P-ring formation protein FlgA